jgi:hypothetical protein
MNVGCTKLFIIAATSHGESIVDLAIRSVVQKVKCRVTELLLLSDTF